MTIALPTSFWSRYLQMSVQEFAQTLKQWAALVNLKRFSSSPRGKKKRTARAEVSSAYRTEQET